MIHTTALTKPTPKKYVPIEVTLKGAPVVLVGLLLYVGGGYEGSVKVMDQTITSWGQRLVEAHEELSEKAQSYIDKMGLRAPQQEPAYV